MPPTELGGRSPTSNIINIKNVLKIYNSVSNEKYIYNNVSNKKIIYKIKKK